MPQPDFLTPVAASCSELPPTPSELQSTGGALAARGRREPASLRSRRDFLTGIPGRRYPADHSDDYWIRVHRRAMACRFEITLASGDATSVPAARAALNEVDRIEDQLSVFREASALSHLNRCAAHEAVEVDGDLLDLLVECRELARATGGAFDVTSTPLSRCWGFLARDGHVPSREAIEHARALVGFGAVNLTALDGTRPTVRFERPGIELNLGAIGKGYALDRVARDMRRSGVAHALLSAGCSSLLAIGGREAGWHVTVVSPGQSADGADRLLANVWLRDAALGTSGAGEQFVIADGTRYGHVIDPRTGWPASGVLSASVIATSAAVADALSTAFLVGGLELAEHYCAIHPDVMALVTPDDGSETVVFGQCDGGALSDQVPAAASQTRPTAPRELRGHRDGFRS
jgi:FAD:protein FMN transferase